MTRIQLGAGHAGEPEQVLRVGELEIYPAGFCVRMAGVKSALPLREFDILLVLAHHAGRVVPAQLLLDHGWGEGFTDRTGTLKTHVNRLRKRLRAGLGADYIRTVRGLGYSLDPELAGKR